jgi:tetratricopeptide (TPR) repeat protein
VRLRLIHLNLELGSPAKAQELALGGAKPPAFLLEAAKLFLNRKHYAQAGTMLDELDPATQKRADVLFYRAAIAFEGGGDAEKALGYMDQVPEGSPLAERAIGFRMHLLSLLGRQGEALDLAAKSKIRFPQSREIILAEAGIFEDAKDFPKALEVLDAALALWPEDIEILYRKGVLLDRAGERPKALEIMESIIAREPDNPDALNYVGYTLAEENRDLDRALVLVRNALGQKPDSAFIIDSLAWVYFRQGKKDAAWKEIRRAAAAAEDPTIWEHYGDIALALGKKEEARKAFHKALKLKPDNEDRVKQKLKAL